MTTKQVRGWMLGVVGLLVAFPIAVGAQAADTIVPLESGTVEFTLDTRLLDSLAVLRISRGDYDEGLGGVVYEFNLVQGASHVVVDDFDEPVKVMLKIDGLLRFRVANADWVADMDFASLPANSGIGADWRLGTTSNPKQTLVTVTSVIAAYNAATGRFEMIGDLTLGDTFADRMGRQDVAGMRIGTFAFRGSNVPLPGPGPDDGAVIVPGDATISPIAGIGPDVIVGDLTGPQNYTSVVAGTKAYAIGTTSCNIGNQNLNWFDFGTAQPTLHPVIGQNMFRYKTVNGSGRFEQIGQAWLKHGFCALQNNLCPAGGCQAVCFGCCDQLGPGCSDPYCAPLNGSQGGLGPKSQIDAKQGKILIWPFTNAPSPPYNAVEARLQVKTTDLDPALNPGAQYFAEGQYVAQDDAAALNHGNNASYREMTISAGTFNAFYSGSTVRESAAIEAWEAIQPGDSLHGGPGLELVQKVQDIEGGYYLYRSVATDLGGGDWHYEYAVQNLNSNLAFRSFSIPIPPGVSPTNIEFHDVSYHTSDGFGMEDPLDGTPVGAAYDGTDWSSSVDLVNGTISWATDPRSVDPNANALRWGTMYNFRFDIFGAPQEGAATMEHYRETTPPGQVATLPSIVVPVISAPPERFIQLCTSKTCVLSLGPPSPVAGGGPAFALRFFGDPGDPEVACVDRFVQADGKLGATAVWQTPNEWGDPIYVNGPDVIPSKVYNLEVINGSPGAPEPGTVSSATTMVFGDVDGDLDANFADIFLNVQGFQSQFPVPLEFMDINPCDPNAFINFGDIFTAVTAFQNVRYDEICAMPCAP